MIWKFDHPAASEAQTISRSFRAYTERLANAGWETIPRSLLGDTIYNSQYA